MKIPSLLPILLIVFSHTAMACLNEYRTTLTGNKINLTDNMDPVSIPHGHHFIADKPANLRRLQVLDRAYHARHRIEDYSDYGVILVYLGRYKQAQKVFEEIEARQPGQYTTAANLGTVYELLGQNKSALHWIQQAVRIKPDSHKNSEWIHVNILKAKLQGTQAVNSSFLLGTDFGTAATPVTTDSLVNLLKLRTALSFQLSERMSFVKPEDKIVGQLLFDLGNIYALTRDVEFALEVYDEAKKYGYHSPVLTKRYAYFIWLIHRDDLLNLVVLTGVVGGIVVGVVTVVRRRRKRVFMVNDL